VAHRNPVTDSDDAKFKGDAPACGDPFPDLLGEVPEMGVAGDDIVPGISYPDEGEIHLLITDPK